MKLLFLLLTCSVFLSCSSLKTQQKNEWKQIGEATVANGQFKVALGNTSNVIQLKPFGKIHLTHKYLDSLDVQKVPSGNFMATFHKVKNVSIEISNLMVKGQTINASFKINSPKFSTVNRKINISLYKNTPFPSNQIGDIRAYILPVIHDFMANLLFQFQDNSCIVKAIRGCGKGKVKSVDVSIFASSCAFICK